MILQEVIQAYDRETDNNLYKHMLHRRKKMSNNQKNNQRSVRKSMNVYNPNIILKMKNDTKYNSSSDTETETSSDTETSSSEELEVRQVRGT
jgi:hypothetical protein